MAGLAVMSFSSMEFGEITGTGGVERCTFVH
jgi:hypothetical protein